MNFIRWIVLEQLGNHFADGSFLIVFFMNIVLGGLFSVVCIGAAGHFPIFLGILMAINLVLWLIPAYVFLELFFKALRKEYQKDEKEFLDHLNK